jgi:hypothetical protein
MAFTKLFSSLTASTIWREEDHTRLVWITMLAMSDKHGIVIASVPGLADLARVSLDKTVLALQKLSSPDEWSATTEYEGRRIEKIDRGWRLLNYVKFRNMRDEEERREYMKELMRERRKKEKEKDRQAEERLSVSKVVSNVSDVSKCYPTQRQRQTAYTKSSDGSNGSGNGKSLLGGEVCEKTKSPPPPGFTQNDFNQRDLRKIGEVKSRLNKRLQSQLGSSDGMTNAEYYAIIAEEAGLTIARIFELEKKQKEWPKETA